MGGPTPRHTNGSRAEPLPRQRQPRTSQELPDLCGRQRGRLPAQWSAIPADELHHRQQAAQLLIAAGHAAALAHLDRTAAGLPWWCRANPVSPTSAPC